MSNRKAGLPEHTAALCFVLVAHHVQSHSSETSQSELQHLPKHSRTLRRAIFPKYALRLTFYIVTSSQYIGVFSWCTICSRYQRLPDSGIFHMFQPMSPVAVWAV